MEITSWNRTARRFLDPPRFTWEPIGDATFYRVRVALRGEGVIWEGTVDTEAFDFAPLWERLPVGEVAWAVTAWGAEGQIFGESGARRFHRAEAWRGRSDPVDPGAWERAAERNIRYLLTYRGPELGLFHRDPAPSHGVAEPADPSLPPYRWHAAVHGGRYLLDRVYPARDFPSLIDGFLAAADHAAPPERQALLQRAVAVGEWLVEVSWPEDHVCSGFPRATEVPHKSGSPPGPSGGSGLWALGSGQGRRNVLGAWQRRAARALRGSRSAPHPGPEPRAQSPEPPEGPGGLLPDPRPDPMQGEGEMGCVSIADAARAARALWRLGRATGRAEFGERAVRLARVLRERQESEGSWPAVVDARTGEAPVPGTRTAAGPARLFDALAAAGDPSFAEAAGKALAWLREGPLVTHQWWAPSSGHGDVGLASTEPLEAVRLLLAHAGEEPERVLEAERLHRWVEDLFVSYGADGSLSEEPYLPAVREWAEEEWVRESAMSRWLDTLRELHTATGDPGYAARADAASDALTRFQRPDGRFSSSGLDRRLGQSGRAEEYFGDNARASAALLRWRSARELIPP